MNISTMIQYLGANGVGVLGVQEPDGTGGVAYCEYDPHVIRCIGNISVLMYGYNDTACALLLATDDRPAKILNTVDSYLKVVSNVKSLLPPRGTMPTSEYMI